MKVAIIPARGGSKRIEKKNINTIIDFGEFGFKGVKIETIFLFLDGNLKEKNKFNFYLGMVYVNLCGLKNSHPKKFPPCLLLFPIEPYIL